jgi:putative ABC transport system permease protein
VSVSDKATVMRGVSVSGQTETLGWLFSLEADAIGDYFGFDISGDALIGLGRTDVPVIVLPMRYQALLGYDVGDPITFDLSPDMPGVTMTIGGFFEKEIGDTAFTNIRLIPSLSPYPDNAILVNASGDRQALKDTLIDAYAPSLVVVLDFEEAFQEKADEIISVLAYVTLVLAVMISCFALSVVIHAMLLAQALQGPTARMRVLGMTDRRIVFLSLIRTALVASVSIVVSGVATFFLMNRVTALVIHFNDYEKVAFDFARLIGSVPLALVIFVPGLLVEILVTRSDRSTDVIRLT